MHTWPSPWGDVGKRWGREQAWRLDLGRAPCFELGPRQLARLEEELPIFPRSLEVVEASIVPQAWGKGLGG